MGQWRLGDLLGVQGKAGVREAGWESIGDERWESSGGGEPKDMRMERKSRGEGEEMGLGLGG